MGNGTEIGLNLGNLASVVECFPWGVVFLRNYVIFGIFFFVYSSGFASQDSCFS